MNKVYLNNYFFYGRIVEWKRYLLGIKNRLLRIHKT